MIPEDAQYLVIASDGLTEQWTVEGAALAVWELSNAGGSPASIAAQISHRCVPELEDEEFV